MFYVFIFTEVSFTAIEVSKTCYCFLRQASKKTSSATWAREVATPYLPQPSLEWLRHQVSFRPSKLFSRYTLAGVNAVKEKDRDWGLNRGLSGSVPHKKSINYLSSGHQLDRRRGRSHLSSSGDRTVKQFRVQFQEDWFASCSDFRESCHEASTRTQRYSLLKSAILQATNYLQKKPRSVLPRRFILQLQNHIFDSNSLGGKEK